MKLEISEEIEKQLEVNPVLDCYSAYSPFLLITTRSWTDARERMTCQREKPS